MNVADAVRRAVVELLRRRQQHLGLESCRTLEPIGHVARDREQTAGLAESGAIEPVDRAHSCAVEWILAELSELASVELVGLSELVHEPDDLVRMADGVGGELRRDDQVDRAAGGVLEVEEPPQERLA